MHMFHEQCWKDYVLARPSPRILCITCRRPAILDHLTSFVFGGLNPDTEFSDLPDDAWDQYCDPETGQCWRQLRTNGHWEWQSQWVCLCSETIGVLPDDAWDQYYHPETGQCWRQHRINRQWEWQSQWVRLRHETPGSLPAYMVSETPVPFV